MIINWKCNICNTEHNGELLFNIIDVKDEYNLVECRPDIALIDNNGNVPIIIEIVVKHEPEKNVIDYCIRHNTTLIRIKVDSINDLENIENKIKYSSDVIYFYKINCPVFRAYLQPPQIIQNQLLANSRPIYNGTRQGGPRIDQVEKQKTRQQFAIRNYYRNKHKR